MARTRPELATDGAVAAHDLYLQGRFYWNKRTGEGMRKAVGFFEEAIHGDPS